MTSIHTRIAQPSDIPAIAKVHVDAWRTTYRDILPADFLAALSYERRQLTWQQALSPESSSIVYVVETELGEIVGFASGGPAREDDPTYPGEIYAIYLLEHAQRQGIGKKFFTTLATHLAQQGMPGFMLWVAAENPARNFYVAMGGKVIKEKNESIGGVTIVEIGYGWDNSVYPEM